MNQVQLQQQQQSGTTLLYNAAGQPVAVALPAQPSSYESYKSGQSMTAGVILIAVGVMSVVFNIIGITLQEPMSYSGPGIWCGGLFIIAGAHGVAAAKKSRCLIIAFMVLAIISASLAAVMFSVSMPGIFIGRGERHPEEELGVMCLLMVLMAVIAAAVAIWGSVLGCKVTCCGGPTTGVVLSTNQQLVLFSQQPYFAAPQVDPMVTVGSPGAPPTYMSSVGNPGINPGIPGPQPLASQMSLAQPGYYGAAAAAAMPSSDVAGSIPPMKI